MKLTADRAQLLAATSAVLAVFDAADRVALAGTLTVGEPESRSPDSLFANHVPADLYAATNTAFAQTSVANLSSEDTGTVRFPLAHLHAILGKASGPTVDLHATETTLVVRTDGGTGRFELPLVTTDPPEDPPGPPDGTDPAMVSVDAAEFRQAVARVVVAADAKPSTRHAWTTTGVLLVATPRDLAFYATDTLHAACSSLPYNGPRVDATTLLPASTLRHWAAATRGQSSVSLTLWDGGACLDTDTLTAITTALTGTFPPVQGSFATLKRHAKTIPTATLLGIVEKVLPMSDEERCIWLRVEPGTITASAASEASGTGRKEEGVDTRAVPVLTVRLHGRRLAKWLATVRGEGEVEMRWETAAHNVSFRAGERAMYLATPVADETREETEARAA